MHLTLEGGGWDRPVHRFRDAHYAIPPFRYWLRLALDPFDPFGSWQTFGH